MIFRVHSIANYFFNKVSSSAILPFNSLISLLFLLIVLNYLAAFRKGNIIRLADMPNSIRLHLIPLLILIEIVLIRATCLNFTLSYSLLFFLFVLNKYTHS